MPPPGGHLPHQDPSGPPHSPRFLPSAPPLSAAAMVAKHSLGFLHCPIPSRAPRVPPPGASLASCSRALGLGTPLPEGWAWPPPAGSFPSHLSHRRKQGRGLCVSGAGSTLSAGPSRVHLSHEGRACCLWTVLPVGVSLDGLVSLQLFLQEPRLCLAACRAGSAPLPTGEPGPAGWSSPGLPQPLPQLPSSAAPPSPGPAPSPQAPGPILKQQGGEGNSGPALAQLNCPISPRWRPGEDTSHWRPGEAHEPRMHGVSLPQSIPWDPKGRTLGPGS